MRLWVLFLIVAALLAVDAVMYDGSNTKTVWAQVREAGHKVENQIDTWRNEPAGVDRTIATGATEAPSNTTTR